MDPQKYQKALKAVKFSAADRAGFEQAINEKPDEAATHHAYADWLQENGFDEDAEFRRAMANWHQLRHEKGRGSVTVPQYPGGPVVAVADVEMGKYPEHDYRVPLPVGVSADHLPLRSDMSNGQPTAYDARKHGYSGQWRWPNYRIMEAAFRRAWDRGRKEAAKPPKPLPGLDTY